MKIEVSELLQTWSDASPPRQIILNFCDEETTRISISLTPDNVRKLIEALKYYVG